MSARARICECRRRVFGVYLEKMATEEGKTLIGSMETEGRGNRQTVWVEEVIFLIEILRNKLCIRA